MAKLHIDKITEHFGSRRLDSIASNLDVKAVQIRLRHASAKTTLDTYSHLWPDSDDSTRAAIDVVMTARAQNLADFRGLGEEAMPVLVSRALEATRRSRAQTPRVSLVMVVGS